jgi:hypothetical protein
VVTTNGIFRPILLVAGRAVATWRLSGGVLRLQPFEALTGAALSTARDEAVAIGRYLGLGPIAMEVTDA